MYIYVCAYPFLRIHMYMYIHSVYTCTHMHMYTDIYIYTHTSVYMYVYNVYKRIVRSKKHMRGLYQVCKGLRSCKDLLLMC